MRLMSVLMLLFFILSGCKPENDIPNARLVLQHDADLHIQLTPATAPVETPLKLLITAANATAISGVLRGDSMYMGEVPLRFYQQDGMWQADFLLGACSDPTMIWQLQLELEFADGKKRLLKQQFQSSWR
jgi:hypothetical protein